MTTTGENGRLGNQIIRNIATSIIAEKFNLHVTYCNYSKITSLGIKLFRGEKTYDNTIMLTDINYFDILNKDILESNVNPNHDYFQSNEISKLIKNHIFNQKSTIVNMNPFKDRYQNNNDCFIHMRMGDIAQSGQNCSIDYYVNALSQIQFDNLYISSDSPMNHIIDGIMKVYPSLNTINCNEIQTMQFGSTCKHVILSHGSFSAIIGYLSFFSNIIYPKYERIRQVWFGDMFTIDGWTAV